jgi:hypothetical protein
MYVNLRPGWSTCVSTMCILCFMSVCVLWITVYIILCCEFQCIKPFIYLEYVTIADPISTKRSYVCTPTDYGVGRCPRRIFTDAMHEAVKKWSFGRNDLESSTGARSRARVRGTVSGTSPRLGCLQLHAGVAPPSRPAVQRRWHVTWPDRAGAPTFPRSRSQSVIRPWRCAPSREFASPTTTPPWHGREACRRGRQLLAAPRSPTIHSVRACVSSSPTGTRRRFPSLAI